MVEAVALPMAVVAVELRMAVVAVELRMAGAEAVVAIHIANSLDSLAENPRVFNSPGVFFCALTCPSAQCFFRISGFPPTTLCLLPCYIY